MLEFYIEIKIYVYVVNVNKMCDHLELLGYKQCKCHKHFMYNKASGLFNYMLINM